MAFDLEKLLKRIWLVNGVLLLLALVLLLGTLGWMWISDFVEVDDRGVQAPTEASPSADPELVRPRAVRFTSPSEMVGTTTRLLKVQYGEGYTEPSRSSASLGYSYSRGIGSDAVVNVLFLPATGGSRLLLDRAAYIHEVDFPAAQEEWRGQRVDTVPWITYSISFSDTDGDGYLGYGDARELYISDLEGGRFRRVLPAGFELGIFEWEGPDRMVVYSIELGDRDRSKLEEAPQRVFTFSPSTGRLTPVAALDSLAAQAGRIVGRRVSDRPARD